ncbi:MAG: guanylyltransferase [Clostridia bacterium]|nr:guanylyltransferase [Clostridia bacterium]
MKFNDLDLKMRVYETAHDYCVVPEVYMVARIDGRNFTRLTKEVHTFESPFDVRFRDYMVATCEHLMNCGFRVVYGYTQSDEISLLFHRDEGAFGRKVRKFNSILAGEASSKFSVLLGDIACFDCRISELPNSKTVIDYFRWRYEDAHRNALNAHCYWMLRKKGKSYQEATDYLSGMTVSEKNELLFQNGINFNDLPNWQKRGVGLYWEAYDKPCVNPVTGREGTAQRRKINVDCDLPMKDDYNNFILKFIENM